MTKKKHHGYYESAEPMRGLSDKEHEKREKHHKKEHEKKEHHRKEHEKKEHHKKSPHKKHAGRKITVAKGVKVAHGAEEKMRSHKGSGSAGKYKTVSPKKFAGAAGGASKYSFPINTLARARNALARAHYAPNPEGIRKKVHAAYPELAKRAQARHKKEE